jgi:hypothetical protein
LCHVVWYFYSLIQLNNMTCRQVCDTNTTWSCSANQWHDTNKSNITRVYTENQSYKKYKNQNQFFLKWIIWCKRYFVTCSNNMRTKYFKEFCVMLCCVLRAVSVLPYHITNMDCWNPNSILHIFITQYDIILMVI